MANKKIIYPNDINLSNSAFGLLTEMLNRPETNFRTADELTSFFRNDSPLTIRNAINELKAANYLVNPHGDVYAVNKQRIA